MPSFHFCAQPTYGGVILSATYEALQARRPVDAKRNKKKDQKTTIRPTKKFDRLVSMWEINPVLEVVESQDLAESFELIATTMQPFLVDPVRQESHPELQAALDEYSTLHDGWDGDDAVAPTQAQIDIARNLLSGLSGGVPVPRPMIGTSGSIGFFWECGGKIADLEIAQDGTFALFTGLKGDFSGGTLSEALRLDNGGSAVTRAQLARLFA